MEIMLFSKWRPSTILNFRKLQFWSRDQYWHVILYVCFKFRVDRPIWRMRYSQKRISIWRPSAILILRKLQFWSLVIHRHVIIHHCSQFRVDRPIWRRGIAKKRFSIWRQSAILNLKNFDFCQIPVLGMEICIGVPNLIEIG